MNPYHDADGRFTEAGNAAPGTGPRTSPDHSGRHRAAVARGEDPRDAGESGPLAPAAREPDTAELARRAREDAERAPARADERVKRLTTMSPDDARKLLDARDRADTPARRTGAVSQSIPSQTADLLRHPFTPKSHLDARRHAAEGPRLLSSNPDLQGGTVNQVHQHLTDRAQHDALRRSLMGDQPRRSRRPRPATKKARRP